MNESSELRDALRVAVPVEPEEKVAERRKRLLGIIEGEIQAVPDRLEKERSRWRLRRGAQLLSVAAALVAALGLGMLVSGLDEGEGASNKSARLGAADGAPSEPEEGSSEAHRSLAGQTFETSSGHQKTLALAGKTSVVLSANTKVHIQEDSLSRQYMRLSGGGISLSVPREGGRRDVQVQTKHATVRVTGTVFSVEVGKFGAPAAANPRTRVKVNRGQVVVDHAQGQVTLDPGDVWLSPVELGAPVHLEGPSLKASKDLGPQPASSEPGEGLELASAPAKEADGMLKADRATHSVQGYDTTGVGSSSKEAPSTLAAQNNLLERALSAEKRGNERRARELVEKFLQRYPTSPLRGSALAVRKRLDETAKQ